MWMEQMLTTRNPMGLLFPEEFDSEGPRVALGSRAFLAHPKKAAQTSNVRLVGPGQQQLLVLGGSDDGYLPVLLPGYGKAWVSKGEITIIQQPEVVESAPSSPHELILGYMTTASIPAVVALMRLVGRDVWRLAITDCECDGPHRPFIRFIEAVFETCPALTELDLSGLDLSTFQFLITAFEAKRCPALKKLTLAVGELGEDDTTRQLFDLLSNPHRSIVTQLSQLHMSFRYIVQAPTIEAAIRMLSVNGRLRDAFVSFTGSGELVTQYCDVFKPPLGLSKVPDALPLRSVLAFLSGVKSRTSVARASDTHLDTPLVRLILAFAGTLRFRWTQCGFFNTNYRY